MTKPSDLLRQAIQDALAESKMGARRFEVEHGLHKWALRGLLDPLRRQAPSVDRAKEICTALGLEFYIGPPREEDEISRVINRHMDDVMSPERELLYEFRAFRKEIVEVLATLSRDRRHHGDEDQLVANAAEEDRLLLAIEAVEESGVAMGMAPAGKALKVLKAYRYLQELERPDKAKVLEFCKGAA